MFLSLNGTNIPNHGYVVISDIGTSEDTALLCNTDRFPDSGSPNSGGFWYAPDGTSITNQDSVPGLYRRRGVLAVRLVRLTDNSTAAEGMYRCAIRDALRDFHSVYAGLYHSGGGVCSVNSKYNYQECEKLYKCHDS